MQIASRLSGPAWRKSSKYLAFALGEVSLTKVNLPRTVLIALRQLRAGVEHHHADQRAIDDAPASLSGQTETDIATGITFCDPSGCKFDPNDRLANAAATCAA